MNKNVGSVDKIVRIILAVVLAYLAYSGTLTGTWAIVAYVVAGVALVTALLGYCPAWAIFGFGTNKKA